MSLFDQAARKESSAERGRGFDQLWKEGPPALKDR